MYDTAFIVRCFFAHLMRQHPCVGCFKSFLADFESVCACIQLDCVPVSPLRDVPAAWLCSCVAPGIFVDIFHSFYLSLRTSFVARQKVKKVKLYHDTTADSDPSARIQLNVPLGTQWQNNSCAYDAIITVLFNIWFDSGGSESGIVSIEHTQCDMFDDLIQRFRSHESCQVVSGNLGSPTYYSLEQIREYFRRCLARISQEFTFGSYASVQSIGEYLFAAQEIVTTSDVFCSNGHRRDGRNGQSSTSSYQILIIHGSTENSLQACVDNFTLELASKCATCNTYLIKRTTFVQTPPLLSFDLSNGSRLTLDPVVWISCENSRVRYVLRGVIYFDNNHFTERVVTSTGMVWYHDGIFTGRSLVYETQNLTSITTENAVMAFYIRSPQPA
jgi:hypothetical protein